MISQIEYNTKRLQFLYYTHSVFVSSIHTASLEGDILVYTPTQCTNKEKYSNHIIYKGKNADCGRKQTPLRPFFIGQRLCHISMEKVWVQSIKNGHQSGYSRADLLNIHKNKDQTVFP